ncbi:hypothetical protein [Actinomadura sp. GTD37]|uniref:hypothetical protein n=1 Tax=Actinomadura sp. GTD37 TaxID=1778030 RepID=UPI0035C0D5BA
MGAVRDLAGRHLLRWRTRLGHQTATRYLDDLTAVLAPQGWRFVRFYRREEFPVPAPAAAQIDRLLKHRLFPATW